MMGFGLIGIVLLVVVVVFIGGQGSAIRGLMGLQQSGQQPAWIESENALDILDQRYSRGEITREQYQSIKQDLV
ncbi:MAG: SHOCT domain-containing protein [Anaerolineales bacterium]